MLQELRHGAGLTHVTGQLQYLRVFGDELPPSLSGAFDPGLKFFGG
jgi:hypothetical protein